MLVMPATKPTLSRSCVCCGVSLLWRIFLTMGTASGEVPTTAAGAAPPCKHETCHTLGMLLEAESHARSACAVSVLPFVASPLQYTSFCAAPEGATAHAHLGGLALLCGDLMSHLVRLCVCRALIEIFKTDWQLLIHSVHDASLPFQPAITGAPHAGWPANLA